MDPTFDRLTRVAADPSQLMQLRQDPEAIAPERAIVFEVAGSLVTFYEEAARIGLEYLADEEREITPDDDFRLPDKPDDLISGRLYFAMPDVEALRQLVSLWQRFKEGRRMADGFGIWTQLFGLLKDVRAWGPQDRLTADALADWAEQLAEAPDEPVRVEIELWFREGAPSRERAYAAFEATVRQMGGAVVHHATIPEIRYDAALIDLPAARIRELIANPTVTLALVNEIMFIRPQSMASFPVDTEDEDDPGPLQTVLPGAVPPVAALLDGLPVQNHRRLQDRLVVDDPEGLEAGYNVRARKHGTAMASLILHGDINRGEPPLGRPLYVRPIMTAVPALHGWDERTPKDRLLIDHIDRAVRRLKEGDGGEPPTAPTVFLINLSMGDPRRPFAGPLSPWARLLDHLAYRHNVLFLVSAGNIRESLSLPAFPDWTAFETASPVARERALYEALNSQKSKRTLLSPAEAMNVLTIGAAHRDAVQVHPTVANRMDAIRGRELPNLSSALGLGYRKAVKPDLLADGGREYVCSESADPHLHVGPVRQTGRAFGLMAAAPDPLGDLSRTTLTWGTSAATALVTRAAHRVFGAMMDEEGGSMLADTPSQYIPVIVKTLLVHGSAWCDGATVLDSLSGTEHYAKKDNVSRFVGHGVLDVARILECTAERATLIGYGDIAADSASVYRIPLPPSLEGVVEPRSVTLTLGWFAPINPRHQGYRMLAMDAGPGGDRRLSLGVERERLQPHHKAIQRGTVYHERRVGRGAVPYVDGGDLLIRIAARETAGSFAQTVPYALAVSIEVGVGSTVPVYDEVRAAVVNRLQPPVTT